MGNKKNICRVCKEDIEIVLMRENDELCYSCLVKGFKDVRMKGRNRISKIFRRIISIRKRLRR